MTGTDNPWGRVSDNGTVEVSCDGEWLAVGAYPDASPEEALALFTRKFDDLDAQVTLAEARLKAGAAAKDIQRSVTKLNEELATPNCVGDIASLRTRLAALGTALTSLAEEQLKQRDEAAAAALVEREEIVKEIEALAAKDVTKIRWKDAAVLTDQLFERWKNHQQQGPRLPKAAADELWKRFKNAKNTLEKGRRLHFQERDKLTKAAKGSKKDLIAKAEALAPKGADGIPAYRTLLDEWKKAPRASKSLEDQLWAQFKAAGDVLYQAKNQQVEAEDEANQTNGDAKKQLVADFSDILTLNDHRAALERIRLFHDRFRQIGPVPRALVKSIDAEVKKFDQHVKKLEAEHWDKSNPEKQARSQSFVDQLNQQISALQSQMKACVDSGDTKAADKLAEEIRTKEAWKGVLTEA